MTNDPKQMLRQMIFASILSKITRFFKSWLVQVIFISGMSFILLLIFSFVTPQIIKSLLSAEWLRSFYDNSQSFLPYDLINEHPDSTYLVFCSAVYAVIVGLVSIASFAIRKLIGYIPEIINKLFFGGNLKIYKNDDDFKAQEYKDFTKPKK